MPDDPDKTRLILVAALEQRRIERALADSDAGRGKPAAEVFDRLDAKYRAMANDA